MRYKTYLVPLIIILSIAFAFISYNRGMGADVNGDYSIYWQTGKHFLNGQKIYTPGLVDGGFTYPPFAALLLSIFSFFPFHTSAFLFTFFINYGLWIASFVLVKKIFDVLYPNENTTLPISLALLFSIAFYWHNYIWMNVNLPVLCFTLLGILYYLKKKFNLSYLFFIAGAFFKITPVIFLFFAAIKRGPKDWPKIILIAIPFIVVPAIFRGLPIGITDWKDYYEAFVAPFSKGKIDENIISLGVPALLSKLNTGNLDLGCPPLLHLSVNTLKLTILIIQLLVFGALTAKFTYDRYVKQTEDFSAADFCMIFLITLLLPGRVWAHHHVCAGFIYTYIFILLRKQKRKTLLIITYILCLAINVLTKDVVGQTLADIFTEYSFITLVMLFISFVIVTLNYLPKSQPELKEC